MKEIDGMLAECVAQATRDGHPRGEEHRIAYPRVPHRGWEPLQPHHTIGQRSCVRRQIDVGVREQGDLDPGAGEAQCGVERTHGQPAGRGQERTDADPHDGRKPRTAAGKDRSPAPKTGLSLAGADERLPLLTASKQAFLLRLLRLVFARIWPHVARARTVRTQTFLRRPFFFPHVRAMLRFSLQRASRLPFRP